MKKIKLPLIAAAVIFVTGSAFSYEESPELVDLYYLNREGTTYTKKGTGECVNGSHCCSYTYHGPGQGGVDQTPGNYDAAGQSGRQWNPS